MQFAYWYCFYFAYIVNFVASPWIGIFPYLYPKEEIQEFVDPARPNKAQYIAAVPPADVEMTDAEKARRYFMTLQAMMQTDPCWWLVISRFGRHWKGHSSSSFLAWGSNGYDFDATHCSLHDSWVNRVQEYQMWCASAQTTALIRYEQVFIRHDRVCVNGFFELLWCTGIVLGYISWIHIPMTVWLYELCLCWPRALWGEAQRGWD